MIRIIGAIVAFFLLIAVFTAMGWQIYRYNLDQQNQANHTSQQYQDGLIAAERDRVQGYDTATNDGQKKQIALTFCAAYQSINHPPVDLVAAQSRLC